MSAYDIEYLDRVKAGAPHSRVVKTLQIWLPQFRGQLLGLLLTIQLIILFVMPVELCNVHIELTCIFCNV